MDSETVPDRLRVDDEVVQRFSNPPTACSLRSASFGHGSGSSKHAATGGSMLLFGEICKRIRQ